MGGGGAGAHDWGEGDGKAVTISGNQKKRLAVLSDREREAALVDQVVDLIKSLGVGAGGPELSGATDLISLGLNSIKAAELMGQLESGFGTQGALSEVRLPWPTSCCCHLPGRH